MPFHTFDELRLPPALATALKRMQFVQPTPIQSASIPAALAGNDILGTAQTGTGKTAAFGIPLVARILSDKNQAALILAPTREIAAQIHGVLIQMAAGTFIRSVLVVGGESFNRQADHLRRGFDILVATPGRLNDHLEQRTVTLRRTGILVLDEVDRMLDMGFIPQVRQILRNVPNQRQTLLFSATLPSEVEGLARAFLKEPKRVAVGAKAEPVQQLTEETFRTTPDQKNSAVLKAVGARQGRILVFTRTQSRTDRLAKLLDRSGHRVVALHGGRSQSQRRNALEMFRSGTHRIMVATDLAGRGIDVADIAHVINYDLPATREDYIHRIGRTGRMGKSGQALNFLLIGDRDGERVLRRR